MRYAPRLPGNSKSVLLLPRLSIPGNNVSGSELTEGFTTITPMPSSADRDDAPDVLPAPLNTLLATLWVGLFGGRWLLVPMLQMVGLLSPEQTADWDEGFLAKLYLILLSITCVVLALRAVRRFQSHNAAPAPERDETT